jgi:hypothetical protein
MSPAFTPHGEISVAVSQRNGRSRNLLPPR